MMLGTEAEGPNTNFRRVTVPIHGLTRGGGGAPALERSLGNVSGVKRAYVNPLTEMAYVEYDPTVARTTQLAAAVERVGLRAGEASLR
jgi:cation transport ATPase